MESGTREHESGPRTFLQFAEASRRERRLGNGQTGKREGKGYGLALSRDLSRKKGEEKCEEILLGKNIRWYIVLGVGREA